MLSYGTSNLTRHRALFLLRGLTAHRGAGEDTEESPTHVEGNENFLKLLVLLHPP